MTLHLSGLRVFLPSTPTADLVAQRLAEDGAQPWVGEVSSLSDATPNAPFSLAVLPADVSPEVAQAVLRLAGERKIPADDQRGAGVWRRDETQDEAYGGNQSGPQGEIQGENEDEASSRRQRGVVTLVGGGPGDPELITVAGARAIERADVILADHLGPYDLAAQAGRMGAEIIDVSKLPYGKQVTQERINELLIEHALQGKHVVRLKGGDPFIFGRGSEEWEAVAAAGIPVRVIPGVTSATSAPAVAGFSLTQRGVNHDVTLVSGHVPPGHPKSLTDWDAVAAMTGTIVLIMAVKNAPAIAEHLLAARKPRAASTPVAIVENASVRGERVTRCTLGDLGEVMAREQVKAPAIFVIGEVAGSQMDLER